MIKSEEITVVLQGSTLPVCNDKMCVELAVKSIRKYLPGCKIIVSTWEGEVLPENLQADRVIYSKDPGFQTHDGHPEGKPNNANRQIVSTRNGLRCVETKYALKMRTDFVMTGSGFLKYFDKYNEFEPEYKIFKKRVLSFIIRNQVTMHSKNYKLPFHIADFSFFGLTEDLIKLYDIPLVTEEEFLWFATHTEFASGFYAKNRYTAEQHIWINCLRKDGVDVKCQHAANVNDEIEEQAERFLINNFYPIPAPRYGMDSSKEYLKSKNRFNINNFTDFYTKYEWLVLYKKYCDSSLKLPVIGFEKKLINWSIRKLEVIDEKIPKCNTKSTPIKWSVLIRVFGVRVFLFAIALAFAKAARTFLEIWRSSIKLTLARVF